MKYQDLTAGFVQAQNHPGNIASIIAKAWGLSRAAVAFALLVTNPAIQFNKAGEPCLNDKDVRAVVSVIQSQKPAPATTAAMPACLACLPLCLN